MVGFSDPVTYRGTSKAVTLILRRESKFLKVKSLYLIHSARPCKNYVSKCSQFPPELINSTFFSSLHTKQKKIVRKPPYTWLYARYALRRMHIHVIKRKRRLKALAPLLLCYSCAHHSIGLGILSEVSTGNTLLQCGFEVTCWPSERKY